MKKGIVLGMLSASLINSMASAESMGPVAQEWRWVGAFSVGADNGTNVRSIRT